MTIESDADRTASYFNSDEHGMLATIDGTPNIPVYYEEEFSLIDFEGADVESGAPSVTCNTSAVSGVSTGDVVSVNSRTFTVRRRENSHDGVTVLVLNQT